MTYEEAMSLIDDHIDYGGSLDKHALAIAIVTADTDAAKGEAFSEELLTELYHRAQAQGRQHWIENARAILAAPEVTADDAQLRKMLEDARSYVEYFASDKEDGHIAQSLCDSIDAALAAAQPTSGGDHV